MIVSGPWSPPMASIEMRITKCRSHLDRGCRLAGAGRKIAFLSRGTTAIRLNQPLFLSALS